MCDLKEAVEKNPVPHAKSKADIMDIIGQGKVRASGSAINVGNPSWFSEHHSQSSGSNTPVDTVLLRTAHIVDTSQSESSGL